MTKIYKPNWITDDLTPYDIAAINQGGCASGAYMPAVTYHAASNVMAAQGDEVLEYIEGSYGDLPALPNGTSWSGAAVFYLSLAVELFCSTNDYLEDWNDDEPVAVFGS